MQTLLKFSILQSMLIPHPYIILYDTDCPEHFASVNGGCYRFMDSFQGKPLEATYDKAKAICEMFGSHLVTISSQEEQAAVQVVTEILLPVSQKMVISPVKINIKNIMHQQNRAIPAILIFKGDMAIF